MADLRQPRYASVQRARGVLPVMAGAGDEMAAGTGGRGHMRASHADREQVIETLKAAFVQGRLGRDEFDLRVGQTFASRTYAELAALTADVPARLTTARPPGPAPVQGEQPLLRPGRVITATTAVYAGVWAYGLLLSPQGGDVNPTTAWLVFGGFWAYLIILVICAGHMVALRREKRSGGEPPRRPAAGACGQASQRLPSGAPLVRDERPVPDTCPIEGSDTDTRGHSWSRRHNDDLHKRWSGQAQSQPSKLVMRVRFPSPALDLRPL